MFISDKLLLFIIFERFLWIKRIRLNRFWHEPETSHEANKFFFCFCKQHDKLQSLKDISSLGMFSYIRQKTVFCVLKIPFTHIHHRSIKTPFAVLFNGQGIKCNCTRENKKKHRNLKISFSILNTMPPKRGISHVRRTSKRYTVGLMRSLKDGVEAAKGIRDHIASRSSLSDIVDELVDQRNAKNRIIEYCIDTLPRYVERLYVAERALGIEIEEPAEGELGTLLEAVEALEREVEKRKVM